jgi:hypothetical protein
MTYDRRRERIVMFGGGPDISTRLTDTWEWDGTDWVQVVTGTSPPGRTETAMTYDETLGRVLLYGGLIANADVSDLWIYDGVDWKFYNPFVGAPTPGQRYGHAMAYDPMQQRLVLFGGDRRVSTHFHDTWTFAYGQVAASEACSSKLDYDRDGAIGCNDADCYSVCTPLCPPTAAAGTCPTTPRCGDGTCNPAEDCRSCPADCAAGTGACPTRCGDSFCDPSENATQCPGDC